MFPIDIYGTDRKCLVRRQREYPDGQANIYLKTEPEKGNGDRYHSVKGNMDGYNEYVIYENRRSLIKYRIVLTDADKEDDDDDDDDDEEEEKDEQKDEQKDAEDDIDESDDQFKQILPEFMKMTNCDDKEFARMIIKEQHFDLHNSVNSYKAMMME